jgi:hypothetical protein
MIARRTEVFDTEKNYWTVFPEMKVHSTFNHYYKEDKSKKKLSSSNIMWAFHLVCHPKALADWEDMIKKRSAYLKGQDYNLDNGKELDTLHKNTYAIFKDYQKVCDELKVEEESNNGALSLSESGEI